MPRRGKTREGRAKLCLFIHVQSLSKEFFLGSENGHLKCSTAVFVSAVRQSISPLDCRNLGKTLLTDSVVGMSLSLSNKARTGEDGWTSVK